MYWPPWLCYFKSITEYFVIKIPWNYNFSSQKIFLLQKWIFMEFNIRFKSPDFSSQKSKKFIKQNKKVLNSLNRKIFWYESKLLQSHWPRRYFLSLYISKQKMICKSILSWPVEFEKKNWSSSLMYVNEMVCWLIGWSSVQFYTYNLSNITLMGKKHL